MRSFLRQCLALLLVPALAQAADLSGRWIITADLGHTAANLTLELKQQADGVSGKFLGDEFKGTLRGNQLSISAHNAERGEEKINAAVNGDEMKGSIAIGDTAHPTPEAFNFTAVRALAPVRGKPRHVEFVPTQFQREFSPTTPAVLHIAPGDTVHTSTVDAGGQDAKDARRSWGPNPQTGPFYVDGAWPGDVLAVHFTRIRLNRDWAASDDYLVPRVLDSGLAAKAKDLGKEVRWHLDRERGVATPEHPGEHLSHYQVPLRPMLGCVAVAPRLEASALSSADSFQNGGNLDFNEVVEGATVYLPVSVSGALLYFGDGHALQGDGEFNGNALETSMEVEFSVEVISSKEIPGPRVESATQLMAVGLAGSLDDAIKAATSNMADWLMDRYALTLSEAAQVVGTAAELRVSEVADRNAGIALKINKERLEPLAR